MREEIFKLLRIYWDAAQRLLIDYGLPLASAATFSGILALFPFMIFVTALAGVVGGAEMAEQAGQALFDRLPHQVAAAIAPEVHRVLGERRGDFLTMGILFTFVFSSTGVESLRTALNRAYRLKENRPVWRRWAQNCVFVIAAALAMLVFGLSIVLTPVVEEMAVDLVPALGSHLRVLAQLRVLIGTGVIAAVLLALHLWLPAGKRRVADILPGILHTMVLWLVAGTVYSAYLARFNYYAATYAGLANVMIALVFFYVMAVIFVFGAELNRAFIEARAALEGRNAKDVKARADAASGGTPAKSRAKRKKKKP